MRLQRHLESLSSDTWERLRDANELGVRFGEETITNLMLLELKRRKHLRSYIAQTPAFLEKDQGTDWEWWIGSPKIGWIRYAIQAKKLYLPTMRYGSITHKVAGTPQIDLLLNYARRNKAVPLYCFYNYSPHGIGSSAWNCSLTYDQYQLACTVTSASIAKKAIHTIGAKSFDWIHKHKQTIPWRCLTICPRITSLYNRNLSVSKHPNFRPHPLFDEPPLIYAELPEEIERARDTGVVEAFQKLRYDEEFGQYPKRIAVLEISKEEEVEFSAA